MADDLRAVSLVAVLDWNWPGLIHELDEPFDLGNEVNLSPLPDWLRQPEAIGHLSLHDRDELQRLATLAFVIDPWAVGRVDPHLLQPAEDRLRRANLALWLACPSSAGFALLLRGEQDREGRWFVRSYEHSEYVRAHQHDWEKQLNLEDLERARSLNTAISRLAIDSATWAAARVTWRALLITEPWWEERYLLFWIALEALFGPDYARETTYRLCQRLALFLENDGAEAHATFECANADYRTRSSIVHGLRPQRLGAARSLALMAIVETLTRRALIAVMTSAENTEIFATAKRREPFLIDLSLPNGYEPCRRWPSRGAGARCIHWAVKGQNNGLAFRM